MPDRACGARAPASGPHALEDDAGDGAGAALAAADDVKHQHRLVLDRLRGDADRGEPVEVALWHCGIDTLEFDGQEWEVPNDQEPFDGTNVPEWFVGRGTVVRSPDGTRLTYTDESGLTLSFVPDDGVEPLCN